MTLLGHDAAWREWRSAMSGSRMHHGWILAGKRGLGKASFADAAARELLRGGGSPPFDGPHPDILALTHLPKDDKEERKREAGKPFELKRNITIGQVRELQRRLTTRPTTGTRRAVIIDPADDMERNAANALLKSLEEPPQGTFFLLVSHSPAKLLPTIRSRCRILRFPDLPPGSIADFLAEVLPDADAATRAAAVVASGGSPGAALAFVEQDLAAIERPMRRILAEGDRSFALRGALAAAIGARPDRERIQATFDLARAVLASEIASADTARAAHIADTHARLVQLAGEAPTYNFDAGLLVMEIGSLLASCARASERADA